MRPSLRSALAALVLVGALAACSDDGDANAGPTATVGTAPPTTQAPTDPYAIPETIDAAYVERVVNKLYEVVGDANRIAKEQANVPTESHDRLKAVTHQTMTRVFTNSMLEKVGRGFEGTKSPPGSLLISVHEVAHSDPGCIIAVGDMDNSQLLVEPTPPSRSTMVLRPIDESHDPKGHNPTPYALFDATPDSPSQLLERGVCDE